MDSALTKHFITYGHRIKQYSSVPDEEIIQAYKLSYEKYLIGILFDRYIHLVYLNCLNYLKEENAAQDLAMEVFEELEEKLKVHEVHNFRSWLYVMTKNHCLMRLRKKEHMVDLSGIEFKLIDEPQDESNFLQLACEKLLNCLGELKEEHRTCLRLMYLESKSYKEISSITGFAMAKVKSYIQNGKRNLKIAMERYE